MTWRLFVRSVSVGAFVLAVLSIAAPAHAQMGSIKGKVVDESGKPVPDADLVFDFVGDVNRQFKGKTNAKGEYVRAGLQVVGGRWRVSASKEGLNGRSEDMEVGIGGVVTVPDIVLKKGAAKPTGSNVKLSAKEAEENNKKRAELEKMFTESKTAMDAGDYDTAITKLEAVAKEVPKCDACYVRIGDAYLKKKDLANAEKAFLSAIEQNAANPDPYGALATIYNEQKKFEEATKMSQKATELMASSGAGADPVAVYNQAIIFWNQSKIPEAKALFEKAVELKPDMADAHYWLGMANVNEGKMPEAKKAFEQYLKVAPTGQHAETVKALLTQIK